MNKGRLKFEKKFPDGWSVLTIYWLQILYYVPLFYMLAYYMNDSLQRPALDINTHTLFNVKISTQKLFLCFLTLVLIYNCTYHSFSFIRKINNKVTIFPVWNWPSFRLTFDLRDFLKVTTTKRIRRSSVYYYIQICLKDGSVYNTALTQAKEDSPDAGELQKLIEN